MRFIYLMLIPMILQSGKPDYEAFKKKFPSFKWDENGNYLTRLLNAKSFMDLEKEFELLSDDETYYYACNEDSSRLYFEYDLYHMEEGYLIKHVKKQYKRYAMLSRETDSYDLLMHAKHDDEGDRFYYLQSYDKNGNLIDEIEANKRITSSIYNSSFYQFLLMQKKGFKVFAYTTNQDQSHEDMRTKVVISDYEISDLGKFNFVSKDSVYLEKSDNHYAKFDNEPEPDDPVYKYWTLW